MLIYQAEPIVELSPGAHGGERYARELLWRGNGTPSDAQLLRSLAQPQLGGRIQLNLDDARALAIPDELVAAAAERHRITLEWVEPESGAAHAASREAEVGVRLAYWRAAYGIQIALDDWDGSNAAWDRVEAIPDGPDQIKVDGRCFRRIVAGDARMREQLGHGLESVARQRPGLMRVVEWVEHVAELSAARTLGADAVQGYLFPSQRIDLA